MDQVKIGEFAVGPGQPLVVLSGPCVIESEEHTLRCAEELKKMVAAHPGINLVFKASYDKANRSSGDSFRGPGLDEGLRILQRVQQELELPVVTDIHNPEQARAAGEVCDIVQIPAFLCRQTDLVLAAGETGKVVNVKKGQFMAPWDMEQVVNKIRSTGNNRILLCDRGTMFGYNNLISDMRAIPIMRGMGCPVCFDASHSTQLPGGQGTHSGGQREFIPVLARSALAAGADSLFIESHPDPSNAKSDATTVFPFAEFPALLAQLEKLYALMQEG